MRISGATLCVLLLAASAGADHAAEGHAWLAAEVARFNADRQGPPRAVAAALVERAVDVERFARLAFRGYIDNSLEDHEDHMADHEFPIQRPGKSVREVRYL